MKKKNLTILIGACCSVVLVGLCLFGLTYNNIGNNNVNDSGNNNGISTSESQSNYNTTNEFYQYFAPDRNIEESTAVSDLAINANSNFVSNQNNIISDA